MDADEGTEAGETRRHLTLSFITTSLLFTFMLAESRMSLMRPSSRPPLTSTVRRMRSTLGLISPQLPARMPWVSPGESNQAHPAEKTHKQTDPSRSPRFQCNPSATIPNQKPGWQYRNQMLIHKETNYECKTAAHISSVKKKTGKHTRYADSCGGGA